MYTLYYNTGEVYRDTDNVLVAPTSDENNLDYLAYIAWVNDGNQPGIGNISPSQMTEEHNQMWELIKNERDRRKTDGGYKVGANWFHSDTFSRTQQIGLVMLGANMPNNVMWKTMANTFILMTPTLAAQIFQSAMISDMTIFATAEQKKVAMLAVSDPTTYDYLSGWPKIYGE